MSICKPLLLASEGQSILTSLITELINGSEHNALLSRPHLTVVDRQYYATHLVLPLAKFLLLWLRTTSGLLFPSHQSHTHTYYERIGPNDLTDQDQIQDDKFPVPPNCRLVHEKCPHDSIFLCYLVQPTLIPQISPCSDLSALLFPDTIQKDSKIHSEHQYTMQILNLARVWLHTCLPHVISKVSRVNYGLLPPQYLIQTGSNSNQNKSSGQGDGDSASDAELSASPTISSSTTRKLSALPFTAKDCVSPSSEFANMEILAGLTYLSFFYQGLRLFDTQQVLTMLKASLVNEIGPEEERYSARLFRGWLESSSGSKFNSQPDNDVASFTLPTLQLGDRLHIQRAHVLLHRNPSVIYYYLHHHVFPTILTPSTQALCLTGFDLVNQAFFTRHICFSGTPHSMLPAHMGRCNYQKLADSTMIDALTNPRVSTVKYLPVWNVLSLLWYVANPTKRPQFQTTPGRLQQHTSATSFGLDQPLLLNRQESTRSQDTSNDCTGINNNNLSDSNGGDSNNTSAHNPQNYQSDFHYSALIDTGALITGFSTEAVCALLLAFGLPHVQGVVFLNSRDETQVLLRTPSNGRFIVPLHECTLPLESRFVFYDNAHYIGVDLPHSVNAVAAITVGCDSTFREVAQAAYRMRGIGNGQCLHYLVVNEVAQLIQGSVVKKDGQVEDDDDSNPKSSSDGASDLDQLKTTVLSLNLSHTSAHTQTQKAHDLIRAFHPSFNLDTLSTYLTTPYLVPSFSELSPVPEWLQAEAIVGWLLIKGNRQEQREYHQFIHNVNQSTLRYDALQVFNNRSSSLFSQIDWYRSNGDKGQPTKETARTFPMQHVPANANQLSLLTFAPYYSQLLAAANTFINGYDTSLPKDVYAGKDFLAIINQSFIESRAKYQKSGHSNLFTLVDSILARSVDSSYPNPGSPGAPLLRVFKDISGVLSGMTADYVLAVKMADSVKLGGGKPTKAPQSPQTTLPFPYIEVIDNNDQTETDSPDNTQINKITETETTKTTVPETAEIEPDGPELGEDSVTSAIPSTPPLSPQNTNQSETNNNIIPPKLVTPRPLPANINKLSQIQYLLVTSQFNDAAESTSLDSECVHEQEVEIQQQIQVQIQPNNYNNFINDRDTFPFQLTNFPFQIPIQGTSLSNPSVQKTTTPKLSIITKGKIRLHDMDSLVTQLKQQQIDNFLSRQFKADTSGASQRQSENVSGVSSPTTKDPTTTTTTTTDKQPGSTPIVPPISPTPTSPKPPQTLVKTGTGRVSTYLGQCLIEFAQREKATLGYVSFKTQPAKMVVLNPEHTNHTLYLFWKYNEFETKFFSFIYALGPNNAASRNEVFDKPYVDQYEKNQEELAQKQFHQQATADTQSSPLLFTFDGLDINDPDTNRSSDDPIDQFKIKPEQELSTTTPPSQQPQQLSCQQQPSQQQSFPLPQPDLASTFSSPNNIYPYALTTQLNCPSSLLTTRAFAPTLFSSIAASNGVTGQGDDLQEQLSGLRMRNVHLVAEIVQHSPPTSNVKNIILDPSTVNLLPIFMRQQLTQIFTILNAFSQTYYRTTATTTDDQQAGIHLEILQPIFRKAGLQYLFPYVDAAIAQSTEKNQPCSPAPNTITKLQLELIVAQALVDSQQTVQSNKQKSEKSFTNTQQNTHKVVLLTLYESASLRRALTVNGPSSALQFTTQPKTPGQQMKGGQEENQYSTITLRDKDLPHFSTSDTLGTVHQWSNLPSTLLTTTSDPSPGSVNSPINVNWSKFSVKELIRLIDGDTFFTPEAINAIISATTPIDSTVSILTQDDLQSFAYTQRLTAIQHFTDAHNRSTSDLGPVIVQKDDDRGRGKIDQSSGPQNNSGSGADNLSHFTSCIKELLSFSTHVQMLLSLSIQCAFFHALFDSCVQKELERQYSKKQKSHKLSSSLTTIPSSPTVVSFPKLITNQMIELAFEELLSGGATVTGSINVGSDRQTTINLNKLFRIITKLTNLSDIDNHTFGIICRQLTTFSSNSSGAGGAIDTEVTRDNQNHNSQDDTVSPMMLSSGPTQLLSSSGMNFIDFSHWVKEISGLFI